VARREERATHRAQSSLTRTSAPRSGATTPPAQRDRPFKVLREAVASVVRAMEFRILGPLEVVGARGALALGPIKPRAVLAVLLLHPNEPVSADGAGAGAVG